MAATAVPYDLVVRAPRAIGPSGEVPMSVGVREGRIAAVADIDAALDADHVLELSADEVLLPGLVDTHVHINEPGRTSWEGFDSATRAAAAGGVTTLIDMPLNSIPPTLDVAALEHKRDAARDVVHVDVGFWGGAVPTNLSDLPALHAAGVFGFKAFMLPSGVDEFPPLTSEQLRNTLATLRGLDALLIVHAEDPTAIDAAPPPVGTSYEDFLASRPASSESAAVATLIGLATETGARAHVVHVSGADAVELLAAARAAGVRISGETCPHYLAFSAADVPSGGTAFKCCPPIRAAGHRDALWRALREGVLDCVVSDHSPCPADLKCLDSGDFAAAWGGIGSLQLGLSATWTEARTRGVPLADVVGWMSAAPARLVGLQHKGRIAEGCDADLCVFAPDEEWTVDAETLHHRNPITPYDGRRLRGVVRRTLLRGVEVDGTTPRGQLLRRAPR